MNKKIFLASSSELKEDRKEFEIFINRKNKDLVFQGIFIELIVYDNFLDAVSKTGLQDEYNKAIRECDIFVMLFFTKVGQYTEEEFETAFGQFKITNKPLIFTYFKDAGISTGSANKSDLMSLWAFQEKLVALKHYYTVYKNIDELRFKFNQQLDKLVADEFIPFTIINSKSYLPPQRYFFGRKKELAIIAEAIAPEARTWGVFISGPGGIGKTALAIRAGHLALTEQFRIKIFLSAKRTHLTPKGVEELDDFVLPNYTALLTELAKELGEESIVKIDPSERAKYVRRLLSDRRALIIFDNIESLDPNDRARLFQFLNLLPLSCKAIVTSRHHADAAAETIRLDQLTQDAAKFLIDKLAERYFILASASESDKRSLYILAGGNPLVIQWIAGQLGREHSKCHTIQDAFYYLKNAPNTNDPLEFIFGDLVTTFYEYETKILSALAQFILPAEISWIADIADLPMNAVEATVREFASRSLVVSDQTNERFLLFPLVIEYLRKKYPDIVIKLRERFITQIFTFIMDNGWDNKDRFNELEMGWPKIASALPIFVKGDDAKFQEVVGALDKFLELSGRWDELLQLNLQAEERSALTNQENAGRRAYRAGEIYFWRERTDDVVACAMRAEHYWQQKTGHKIALALHLKGLGLGLQNDFASAIEAHSQSLAIYQSIDPESIYVAMELNDLANAERLSGDYESAENHYESALRIDEKIGNQEGVVIRTGNLALLALNRKDLPKSEELARRALSLAESLNREDLIAHNCRRIGWSLVKQGRPNEGLPFAKRAFRIYQKYPSSRRIEDVQALLRECGST